MLGKHTKLHIAVCVCCQLYFSLESAVCAESFIFQILPSFHPDCLESLGKLLVRAQVPAPCRFEGLRCRAGCSSSCR